MLRQLNSTPQAAEGGAAALTGVRGYKVLLMGKKICYTPAWAKVWGLPRAPAVAVAVTASEASMLGVRPLRFDQLVDTARGIQRRPVVAA